MIFAMKSALYRIVVINNNILPHHRLFLHEATLGMVWASATVEAWEDVFEAMQS